MSLSNNHHKRKGRSRFHRLQSDPCDRRWGLLKPAVTAFTYVTGGKSGTCFKGDACQVTWHKDSASRVPVAHQGPEFLAGSVCQPSLPEVPPSVPKSSLFGSAAPGELGMASSSSWLTFFLQMFSWNLTDSGREWGWVVKSIRRRGTQRASWPFGSSHSL